MAIQETNTFQSVRITENLKETPTLLLEHSESKNKVELLGKVLEAQYRTGDDYLLLITEGSPFEEALYIYLLSNELQVKDALELSAMYTEGLIRNLTINDSDSLRFSFFERNEKWILTILDRPRYTFRKNKYPVKRKLSVFRRNWLALERSVQCRLPEEKRGCELT